MCNENEKKIDKENVERLKAKKSVKEKRIIEHSLKAAVEIVDIVGFKPKENNEEKESEDKED